jgi:predicted MFS family arabinose efflux permease
MGLLLKHRAFARAWAAGLSFLLAWWALHAVMLIHVFDLTGSPFATGLIPVFSAIPGIVLGPIAGTVVDRNSRPRVMAACALALVALLLLALPFANRGEVGLLYAIIFIQSAVMAFFTPAENALLPNLVPADDLGNANALNALNDSLGRIVGPPIGAWLLVLAGFEVVLIVTAALYFVGWGFLAGLRDTPRPARAAGVDANPFRAMATSFPEGIRAVRGSTVLLLLVSVSGLFLLADVPLSAVLPAFMRESVGVSAEVFGSTMSIRGLTGLLGGLLIVWLSRRVAATTLLAGGLLVHGLSFLAFGLGNNLLVSILVLFPIGPAAAAIQTGLFTLLQQAAPDAIRGRVFALVGTVDGAVVLTTSITAGALAEVYGTRAIVIASGCLHLLPLLVALILLRRDYDVVGIRLSWNHKR